MAHGNQDLDRFKRRLIRTVARMKEENVPDLWESVDKALGKNCKHMWELMRSLTQKKLSRMLQCGDDVSRISPSSRMTLTDWLLFDMVMVHEDIDTIHTNTTTDANLPQLNALLKLVVAHGLENCSKDTQAANWASAAMDYNSKGHRCSPMLLQRRWYELKRETRTKFYKFWEVFKRPNEAERPSEIHKEIATKYPHIVTTEEQSWSDLMKEGKIVLPYEFEKTVQMKESAYSTANTSSGSTDDIVLIEPGIETINLENEMEDEISSISTDNIENIDRQIACSETVKTSLGSWIEIADENEVTNVKDIYISASDDCETVEEITKMYPSNQKRRISEEEIINVENPDETQKLISIIKKKAISEETHECVVDSDDCQIKNDNVKLSTVLVSDYQEFNAPVKLFTDKLIEKNIVKESRKESVDAVYPNPKKCIIKEEAYELPGEIVPPSLVLGDSESLGPPIILKVETLASSHEIETDVVVVNTVSSSPKKRAGPKSKTTFSPVKLHDNYKKPAPKCFKNRESSKTPHMPLNKLEVWSEVVAECEEGSFEFADEEVDIDVATLKSLEEQHGKAINEYYTGTTLAEISKDQIPRTSNAVSSDLELSSESTSAQKFDLKLLMLPVVCIQSLSDMEILNNMDLNNTIFGTEAISAIEELSKPKNPENKSIDQTVLNTSKQSDIYDGECLNDSMDFEEYIEASVKTVKETSSLFQKPKNRKYTTIKLCKNPDFNTRLRRLSVAFLMSQRNRQLLKACKALTIDLHKSFEERLVDGIIKIDASDKSDSVEINDFDHENTSIAPSNMAAQSLIDNETVDIEELVDFSSIRATVLPMRPKPINLPDMDTQRIINKRLKIAQVTPLNQVSATDSFYGNHLATSVIEGSQNAMISKTIQSIGEHNHKIKSRFENSEYEENPLQPVLSQSESSSSSSRVVNVGGTWASNIDTKINQDKVKNVPWRPLPKKERAPAWTRPRLGKFPYSTGPFLLKEDSLARMLAALAPRQEINQNDTSILKPLQSTKYCCTAKRHVVLNQARLRLLMTRASSDRERRRLSKELKIHNCKSFYTCSCCCRHMLEVKDDNTKRSDYKSSTPPRVDEVTTALASLEHREQSSPERDYTPAAVMASAYTPATLMVSPDSPSVEVEAPPPPDKGRKKATNKNKRKSIKDSSQPDIVPIKRSYTRKKSANPNPSPRTSKLHTENFAEFNPTSSEIFTVITSDDEAELAGASANAIPDIRVYSEHRTTSFKGNKPSFKLTKKAIIGRGIRVPAKVTGTITNAIMSRAQDTWDSIKSTSSIFKKITDITSEKESQTSAVAEISSIVDSKQVVYVHLPVGTTIYLKDGQIHAIHPETNSEIKFSDEERSALKAAYTIQDNNLKDTVVCVPDHLNIDVTGTIPDTLPETVMLDDDDGDVESPKIKENEQDIENNSPEIHKPCSTSTEQGTANVESDETRIMSATEEPMASNRTVEIPTVPQKKSILSDLMEISGISTEDETPYNESNANSEILEVSNETENPSTNTMILTPITTTPKGIIVTDTSGGYFLVNAETGVITPLTVESCSAITPSHESVSRIPFILQRKRSLEERTELRKPILRRTRKQTLNKKKEKVEAKIDLVDSDAPVYEEYLIESDSEQGTSTNISKDDLNIPEIKDRLNKILHRKKQKTIAVQSDSSDEEPLSVIAMKKHKLGSDNLKEQIETIISEDTNQSQSENVIRESKSIEKASKENGNTEIRENLALETIPKLYDHNFPIERNNLSESRECYGSIEAIAEKPLYNSEDESQIGEEDLILGI